MSSKTWDKVMSMKKNDNRHLGVANTLTLDEIQPIIGTIDFFGDAYQQDIWDLRIAKYRIFDWLAMRVQGRGGETSTKVLVYSFLKVNGDVDKFIEDLAVTDYQVDESWEAIEL